MRRPINPWVPVNFTHILCRSGVAGLLLLAAGFAAPGQFKEIREAPFPAAEAPSKIHTLLEKVTAENRNQIVATLLGWADWYRDILDRELISFWKQDGRASLVLVLHDLADAPVASEVVEFSWREQRPATFTLAYASTLGDLMARYPDSARPFLDDLLSGQVLSQPETEAVCRILIDMPDIGTWRKNGLEILPLYRQTAESLLTRDVNGPDREKMYQADSWLHDLKWRNAGATAQQSPRPATMPMTPPTPYSPAATSPRPSVTVPAPDPQTYNGARSGTLESSGGPIPQNGEYVFRNLPPVRMHLDFDTKHWEASLEPSAGETQRLVVRNIGNGPQKRCVIHWTAIP
jgi:hypothetical protein